MASGASRVSIPEKVAASGFILICLQGRRGQNWWFGGRVVVIVEEGKKNKREFLSKNCQENIAQFCVRLNRACGMCHKATGFHMVSVASRNVQA